jgi:two-component system LytT family response regulator
LSAIDPIKQNPPDILLCDIEMPQLNGFELLEKISNPQINVIFITAYDRYAIKAIKVSALDYILKPFSNDELYEALNKVPGTWNNAHLRLDALAQKDEVQDFIVIRGVKEFVKIKPQNILYAEGQRGGYTTFVLKDGKQTVASRPLAYFEDVLDEHFYKVHKGHIVNTQYVERFDKANNSITLVNGEEIDVAVRRKAGFINHLKEQGKH